MSPLRRLTWTLLLVLVMLFAFVSAVGAEERSARMTFTELELPEPSRRLEAASQLFNVDAGDVTPPGRKRIEPQKGLRGRGVRAFALRVGNRLQQYRQGERAIRGVFVVDGRLPGGEVRQFVGARRAVLRFSG